MYKVWAFKKVSNECDCSSFQFIDFDVVNFEPQILNEEEYKVFIEGRMHLPYRSTQEFVFLIHPPNMSEDEFSVTNVVRKCVELGEQAVAKRTDEQKNRDARVALTAEKKKLKNEDRERRKFEELKKKFEGSK